MTKKTKGFTLLELLVAIIILGIMMTMALPSFKRMIIANKMRTIAGEWRSAFYLAQKEAISRKHSVGLCPTEKSFKSTDVPFTDIREICDGEDKNYSNGWIIFDDTNKKIIRDYPSIDSENFSLDLQPEEKIDVSVNDGAKYLIIRNNGRLPPNFAGGNLTITHTTVKDLKLKLSISRAGQVRFSDK